MAPEGRRASAFQLSLISKSYPCLGFPLTTAIVASPEHDAISVTRTLPACLVETSAPTSRSWERRWAPSGNNKLWSHGGRTRAGQRTLHAWPDVRGGSARTFNRSFAHVVQSLSSNVPALFHADVC